MPLPSTYYLPLLFLIGCSHAQSPVNSSETVVFVNQSNHINHLWLMDLSASGIGSDARRLTTDTEAENYPSWSPDGKRLAYQRDYNGSAIYIVDADGSHSHRISPTPGFDATPSWSPDGTQIVYTRMVGFPTPGQVPATEIHVMKTDGSGDRIIFPASAFSVEPRWSIHNQIVFMSLLNGGQQIFTMNADGTGIRQLTTEGDNGDPAWSPDGTQISFGSDREGNGKLNIFVMQADGSHVTQLTHFDVPDESGDTNWSPDGTQIIFEYDVAGQRQSNPNAYAAVWTIRVNGDQPQSTGQPCSSVGCAPRWQPK